MAQKLRFGGPNLPEGSHTWYENTQTGNVVNSVKPGDVADVADVVDAEGYVMRGQATLVGKAPKEAKSGS